MDEQLGMLIQLQDIDVKIRNLAGRKKKMPEILADLERRREANRADFEKVTESLQTAQKLKRDRDKDLEAGAQKVEKLKSRTSEIKTNKEYQALLKEIENAEQENKAVEDEILVLMEKIDATSAEIDAAGQKARQDEEAIQIQQKKYEADIAVIDGELDEIERARQELASRINSGVLNQYQKLLGTKQGVALAEAKEESCSGCYMSIPPQVFVNVKKNEGIITCPQCERILYFKETIA